MIVSKTFTEDKSLKIGSLDLAIDSYVIINNIITI